MGPSLSILCACLAAAASSVGAVHSWPTGGTKAGGSGRIAERAHLPRRPLISTALLALSVATPQPRAALAAEATVRMEGLRGSGKSKTSFSDFTTTESGLQFKDYKAGNGAMPKSGDRVVIDWTGVTVGYQGRYFQTRNKPKGGAFEGDGFLDFLSFTVGDGSIIPAIDEAVRSMSPGGVRRIIVPEEIGYPAADRPAWKRLGPAPSTFSGERALDFVLSSRADLMDKTLMFDLKLVSVNGGRAGK